MKLFLRSIAILILATPAFGQNDVITPNENLVVEGVAPIQASLAETVNRYTNLRAARL